jgi:hypothetical protein
LIRSAYEVRPTLLNVGQELVRTYHYAKGGSNTATFMHGLYAKESPKCLGIAWWIPPTKGAALATWPEWRRVLALSRLVIVPGQPTNAATFLLAASIRAIARTQRWACLITYADEWQGHTGAVYRASNWEYMGLTTPEAVWQTPEGRMVARKAGGHTRTKAEMETLGYHCLGRFAKHKYRFILEKK